MTLSTSPPDTSSSSLPKTKLSFKNFCATVERFHFKYNCLPTRPQFNGEYGLNISQEKWEAYTTHASFATYLSKRHLLNTQYATPEMIAIADCILDTTIAALPIKLKNQGLTLKDYNAVKNNPIFLEVLRERTNRLPERERSAVFAALARRAADGNVGAAKLYLEVTGEYTPKTTGTIEVNTVSQKETVAKLLEAIQRHVSPEKLVAIVNDFEAILTSQDELPLAAKAIAPVPRIYEPEFDID